MLILHKLFTFLKNYKFSAPLLFILMAIVIAIGAEHKDCQVIKVYPPAAEKKVVEVFLEGEYEDYLQFVRGQSKEKRLEWKQFVEIQALGRKVSCILEKGNSQISSVLHLARENRMEEMFVKLKEILPPGEDENAFETAFFMHMVELGETSPDAFTRELYADLIRIKRAVALLKSEGSNSAYSYYQSKLANLLQLDVGSVLNRYLLKVAMEKQIFSSQEIAEVKEELLALPAEKICAIIRGECEVEHHY